MRQKSHVASHIQEICTAAMVSDMYQSQLLRYAADLQELMDQHAQLQQHHEKVLELLQQGSLDGELLLNLALHDPLTGLPNRRLLEQRLMEAMLDVASDGTSVYVLYTDLDRFKPVNDAFGHGVGDQVLQEVSRRLQAAVRRGDTVARVGGDEFVVVLQKMESHAVVVSIVKSILKSMQEPISAGEHRLHIGISVGCAHHPCDGTEIADLLKHADAAMYQAKQTKAGYAFYSEPSLALANPKTAVDR
jgi:diguanylate cyclase (GGDEF)-like protein